MRNWKVTRSIYETNSFHDTQPRFVESSTFVTTNAKQALRRFACYRYEAEVLADQYHKLPSGDVIFSYNETKDFQFHQVTLSKDRAAYIPTREEQMLVDSYVDHLRQCI